jgi:hypothetical protein
LRPRFSSLSTPMTLQASEAGTPWQLPHWFEFPVLAPKELPRRVEARPFMTRSYADGRVGAGEPVTAARFF